MDVIYVVLSVMAVLFFVILWFLGPLMAECWEIMMLPIGAGLQWVACKAQVFARIAWEKGRRLENSGKIANARRSS
jgi:hypothetical protein